MKPTGEKGCLAVMENHPEKFDGIGAGAGMRGLTAASLFAHFGIKVLVHSQLHP